MELVEERFLLKKNGTIYVIRTWERKRMEFLPGTGVWLKKLFDEELGSTKDINLGVAWYEPECGTSGRHFHDCEEVEYVISGHGIIEAGGKKYDLEPGVAIYEPEGVVHKVVNTRDEPLVILWAHPSAKPKVTNLDFGP